MVLARTNRPESITAATESNLPQAAWRTGPVFVTPARKSDSVLLSTADALREYASFVVDQEAQYCQQ
ncbi:MAG TPA: hypothetical protein VFA18_13430 [Gemmataceae bacterium]|nr:hypothetical protein [Gemmataceae bacterium]